MTNTVWICIDISKEVGEGHCFREDAAETSLQENDPRDKSSPQPAIGTEYTDREVRNDYLNSFPFERLGALKDR